MFKLTKLPKYCFLHRLPAFEKLSWAMFPEAFSACVCVWVICHPLSMLICFLMWFSIWFLLLKMLRKSLHAKRHLKEKIVTLYSDIIKVCLHLQLVNNLIWPLFTSEIWSTWGHKSFVLGWILSTSGMFTSAIASKNLIVLVGNEFLRRTQMLWSKSWSRSKISEHWPLLSKSLSSNVWVPSTIPIVCGCTMGWW